MARPGEWRGRNSRRVCSPPVKSRRSSETESPIWPYPQNIALLPARPYSCLRKPCRPINRLMVGMLSVGSCDLAAHSWVLFIRRSSAGNREDLGVPVNAALIAILVLWGRFMRMVKCSHHDANVVALGIVKGEWSTAVPAKPAPPHIRTHEIAEVAACHLKGRFEHWANDRKRSADGFLAHTAVADMNV